MWIKVIFSVLEWFSNLRFFGFWGCLPLGLKMFFARFDLKHLLALDVALLQLLLSVSRWDALLHFWSSFIRAFVCSWGSYIVSTKKLTNTLRRSNSNHIFHQMWCWVTDQIGLENARMLRSYHVWILFSGPYLNIPCTNTALMIVADIFLPWWLWSPHVYS